MQTRNGKLKSQNKEAFNKYNGSNTQSKTYQKRKKSKKRNKTTTQQIQIQKEQKLDQFFDIQYAQGLKIDKRYNLNVKIKWDGYDKSEISLEPYDNIGKNGNFWCIQNYIQNLSHFTQYGKAQCQGDTLYLDDQQYTIGSYKQQKQQQKQIEEKEQLQKEQQQEQQIVKIKSTSERETIRPKKNSQTRNSNKKKDFIEKIKQEQGSNQEESQQFFVKIDSESVRENMIKRQTQRELRCQTRNSKKEEILQNKYIKQEVIRPKCDELSSSEYIAEKVVDEEQKSVISMHPQIIRKSNNQQEIIKRLLSLEGSQLYDYLQRKFKFFLFKSKKIASMNLLNRYLKLLDQNMVILNNIQCQNGYGVIPNDKAIFIASHKINIVRDRKSGNLQMKLMFELEFGFDELGRKLKNNFAKPYKLYKCQRLLFLNYIDMNKDDLGFLPEMFKKYKDQKKYISLKLRASRKIFYEALKAKTMI